MGTLGLETTLASSVADGVDLTVITGVLETALSFDTVSLELINIIFLIELGIGYVLASIAIIISWIFLYFIRKTLFIKSTVSRMFKQNFN